MPELFKHTAVVGPKTQKDEFFHTSWIQVHGIGDQVSHTVIISRALFTALLVSRVLNLSPQRPWHVLTTL